MKKLTCNPAVASSELLGGWQELPDAVGWWWKWFCPSPHNPIPEALPHAILVDEVALGVMREYGDMSGPGIRIIYHLAEVPLPPNI